MHQAEHNLGDHEDPVAGPTWMVSIVGVILLVVIFLGLTALYYNIAGSEVAERVLGRPAVEVEALKAEQSSRIHGLARWERRQVEGEEEGVMEDHLIIPIDRAMQLVVEENGKS